MGDRNYGVQKWEYEYFKVAHYTVDDMVSNEETNATHAIFRANGEGGFELVAAPVVDGIFTLIFKRPYTDGEPVPAAFSLGKHF